MPVGISLGALPLDQGAIRLHTLFDLRSSVPSFIHISDGKLQEVNILEFLITEAGAFYVMDRGYTNFEHLYALFQAGAFFVIWAKANLDALRLYSALTEHNAGMLCDQTIAPNGCYTSHRYSEHLRCICFKDKTGKRLVFLTNHFRLSTLTICAL